MPPRSSLLFHWSPTARRKQIIRYGLRPGCWSIERDWRPPYVCFASSPSRAWSLSGQTPRGRTIPEWDLWQTWTDRLDGHEVRTRRDRGRVVEVRVFDRIYKRDIWYVGSRCFSGGR